MHSPPQLFRRLCAAFSLGAFLLSSVQTGVAMPGRHAEEHELEDLNSGDDFATTLREFLGFSDEDFATFLAYQRQNSDPAASSAEEDDGNDLTTLLLPEGPGDVHEIAHPLEKTLAFLHQVQAPYGKEKRSQMHALRQFFNNHPRAVKSLLGITVGAMATAAWVEVFNNDFGVTYFRDFILRKPPESLMQAPSEEEVAHQLHVFESEVPDTLKFLEDIAGVWSIPFAEFFKEFITQLKYGSTLHSYQNGLSPWILTGPLLAILPLPEILHNVATITQFKRVPLAKECLEPKSDLKKFWNGLTI